MGWVIIIVGIAVALSIVIFNRKDKEKMKPVNRALILGMGILIPFPFPFTGGLLTGAETIVLIFISVVSIVLRRPLATILFCGLYFILPPYHHFHYEGVLRSLPFIFLIYGLILCLWSKLYKFKEKDLTIKTLSIFVMVQSISLFVLFLFRWGWDDFIFLLIHCIFRSIPITILVCIIMKKQLVIKVNKSTFDIKSTLRIIGRVALLLVVMGFFMPVGCEQTSFELANNILRFDSSNAVGITLYVLFFVSFIGGLFLIPLVMKKKISIGLDWVSILISVGCAIFLTTRFKDLFSAYGRLSGQSLHIGGYFIIVGLVVSLLAVIIASFIKENDIPPTTENKKGD